MLMAWTSSTLQSMAKMQALSCGRTLRKLCRSKSSKVRFGSCLLCHKLRLLIAEVASVGAHVKVQVNCSSAKCLTAALCMRPYSGHAKGLCMRAGPSGSHLAATVADHTFFQYERTLQREYNPELSISLPPLQAAGSQAALAAQPQSAVSEEPPAPSASAQPAAVPAPAAPPAPAPGAAAEQASKGVGELRTVVVKVSYELRQPATGLHFSRSHVHTGNQV